MKAGRLLAALGLAVLALLSTGTASAWAAPYAPAGSGSSVNRWAVPDEDPEAEPDPVVTVHRLDPAQYAPLLVAAGLAVCLLAAIFVLALVR